MKEQKKLDKKKKALYSPGFVYFNMINCKVISIKKYFFMQIKMSGFISLLRNRIHKKEETKKLNLLSNFVESFYKDFLDGIDFSHDIDFQQQLVNNLLSEDVKKFPLATSNFGEEIQWKLDLYITNNRLNEASFRRKLDPISKNIIRNKNPIELLLERVKHFDGQNPVIGFFIKEVDVGKRKKLE